MLFFAIRSTAGAAIAILLISACQVDKFGTGATSVSSDNESTANPSTPVTPTTSKDSSGTTAGDQGSTSAASGAESLDLPATGGDEVLPCETWNDNCPDGMKCIPYFDGPGISTWDSQGCFPVVESPDALGEACVYAAPVGGMLDTCDKGLVCFNNACMPLCEGEPSKFTCPGTFACATVNNPNLVVCLPTCDPRKPCDSADDVCHSQFNIFSCGNSIDNLPAFSDCQGHNQCESGFCAPNGTKMVMECQSDFCCAALCNTDAPQCPSVGQTCEPFFELPDAPEFENLGKCSL